MSVALDKFRTVSDVLWAFGRLPGEMRLTLAQNPKFYTDLHVSPGQYGGEFKSQPTDNFVDSGRVYVLTSNASPVFFECGEKLRMIERLRVFDNVWRINDILIFKRSCLTFYLVDPTDYF
jgi:hypothetical protein